MLWLNYLRQSGEAYADLKRYLDEYKAQTLEQFMHAKDVETLHRLQGHIDCVVDLQLVVTQEERADRDRAHQADRAARERRGEVRA